ncbi:MAG: transglutaminase domain-containing protein [Balneolaceae bacterium]
MKKLFCLTVFLLFINLTLYGQVWNFGDIPKEQLTMEFYDKDSTANAVVLFDVGSFFVDEKLEIYYKRHVRIKVLTDEGLSVGDVAIDFREENPSQRISKLKAETHYIDSDGKVKKTKLGRRDRFENKRTKNWSELKFTAPGLRKGAVFEYSYEMKSESPVDVPDWYFQREIPVIWSEYTARIPEWFTYLPYTKSYHPFIETTQKNYNAVAHIRYTIIDDSNIYDATKKEYKTERLDYSGTEYKYAMQDVPAIVSEPYMKARVDYLAQIRFQLAFIQFPRQLGKPVLRSWPALVELLNNSDNYGKRLRSSSTLKGKAAEIAGNKETELEKMVAIYDHVSQIMDWDNYYSTIVHEKLDDLYNKGTGNSTEINFVLIQMMRDAGIEAHPVVMSTRNNGEIISIYPILDQFNHTLALVKADEKYYLLDAKNDKRPYNILPSSALNGRGLIIQSEKTENWVNITNSVPNSLVSVITLTVGAEGEVTGNISAQSTGYFALNDRGIFESNTPEENIKSVLFADQNGLVIDSISAKESDRTEPFQYNIDYSYSNDSNSDVIYINPLQVETISTNPFKKRERTYPVDYDYDFTKSIVVSMFIDEGWELEEALESKAFKLPNDSGMFYRLVQVQGSVVSFRYNFAITKQRIAPEDYEALRNFYEDVANNNAERIVLKKSI